MRAIIFAGLGLMLGLGPSWAGAEGASPAISPYSYRTLTCPQIVQKAREVSREVSLLLGLQPGTGGSDNTETKSAVINVWPASANAPADKMPNLRYAESQINALEQASIDSQCSILFERPAKIQTR